MTTDLASRSGTRTPPRWQRVAGPAVVIGGLAAASVALHLRDPHHQYSWGVCPSYALLGLYCPGCGGLRAVNDLGNGQILAAAQSNLLFVAFVPVICWALAGWLVAEWRGVRYQPRVLGTAWFGSAFLALMALFTLARNLPGMTWLQP